MRSICLHTFLPCSAEEAAAHLKKPSLLLYVARPLVVFSPCRNETLPETWQAAAYRLNMHLFGLVPLGWQIVDISYPAADCFTMLDNGRGALIRRWRHTITVKPQNGGCLYRDHVEIDAGRLTAPMATAARLFFRHRQRRLRHLAANGFWDAKAV